MKIPKQAKSTTAKVREIRRQYPNEIGENPAGYLRCNFCDALVKCEKKNLWRVTAKVSFTKLIGKNKQLSRSANLQYITLDPVNFKEKVVFSFLASDIPFQTLNHPALKSLFGTMGKPLPSDTAARASVAQLANQNEENIRELLRDKKEFLIVDEAEVNKQKYINVLVCSLDNPNETFIIECLSLESSSNVNDRIILHTVDDVSGQLGTKQENLALLLTDAAWYVALAGKTLKKLYPILMHVTCIAHLLHYCSMRVRAFFKNIDDVVATERQQHSKTKIAKMIFMILVCHYLRSL